MHKSSKKQTQRKWILDSYTTYVYSNSMAAKIQQTQCNKASQKVVKVDAYDAMKSRTKSRENVNFVEFPSDVPLSVDGIVFDPVPAPIEQNEHSSANTRCN